MGSVVETDVRHKRGIGVGAFLLAVATLGAIAHVGVRMKGLEVAYDLGREKQINTKLEEERRRLNIEIGMLKDPVRVVSFARDKLRMGPPAASDIVRLAPGQTITARQEEAAAAAAAARRLEEKKAERRAERRATKAKAGAAAAETAPSGVPREENE